MADHVEPGAVLRYPYLWRWQAERGEHAGRKFRPTVVVIRFTSRGRDQLYLVPLTAQQPGDDRDAYELPVTEVRRLGGDAERIWAILDEANIDQAEGSFYLEPDAQIGRLSPLGLQSLRRHILEVRRRGRVRDVRRFD